MASHCNDDKIQIPEHSLNGLMLICLSLLSVPLLLMLWPHWLCSQLGTTILESFPSSDFLMLSPFWKALSSTLQMGFSLEYKSQLNFHLCSSLSKEDPTPHGPSSKHLDYFHHNTMLCNSVYIFGSPNPPL